MCVGGKFRLESREQRTRLLRRYMMGHDVFNDGGLVVVFRVRDGDLVHHEGGALRMLLEVLAVARVAGQDDRASVVVDAIAVGRLDQGPVVDLERGDRYAVLLI